MYKSKTGVKKKVLSGVYATTQDSTFLFNV